MHLQPSPRSRSSLPEASDTTPAHDLPHPTSETKAGPAAREVSRTSSSLDPESPPLIPTELPFGVVQAPTRRSEPGSAMPFSMLSSFSSPGFGYGQDHTNRTSSIGASAAGITRRHTSTHSPLSYSSSSIATRSQDATWSPGTSSFDALRSGSMSNPFRVGKEKDNRNNNEDDEAATLRRISSTGLIASQRASKRSDGDEAPQTMETIPSISATSGNRPLTPQQQRQPQHRLSGGIQQQLPSSLLGGQGSSSVPSLYGGLGSTTLGNLTSSNSPFRGLSSIGGGGNSGGNGGADILTPAERDHSKDLQIEKSRLLEQLRDMRGEVDELEAQLQALRRKKARSTTISQAQQQRKRAKEALDMRKLLYKLNSTTVTPIKKSLDEENKTGRRDRTSLISNGQLFRSSVSASNMSGLDHHLLQQLRSFTNISFTQIRSQLEPFEETSTPSTKSPSSSRLDSNLGADDDDDDDDPILISKSRHYHYQGSCFELEFDVKFVVREPDLVLEGLTIKVPTSVEAEIGTFLERAEKDSSLLQFFRTFHRYAHMNYRRKKLWNKCARHYPHLVAMATLNKDQSSASSSPQDDDSRAKEKSSSLSSALQLKRKRNEAILPGKDGVQVLTFRSSKRTDMELVLNWRIHVDQHGQLTPLLRLLPKVTSLWKQADQKAVVENLPIQFLRLMEMKGVEGAVVTILKSVYGQEATATTSIASSKTEGDGGDESESESETDSF